MSDWQTFCTNFNTSQDNDKQYPQQCDVNQSKMNTQQILQLISRIQDLKTASTEQSLKQEMFNFCCMMNTRKQLGNQLQEAKNNFEVAKGRVSSLRNPASDVSYLGTSVPFGRPLRTDSVPILLAISISMIIISLGMMLNLSNIQIAYKSPSSGGVGSFFNALYISYQQTSWQVLLITAVLSAGAAGSIYYGIQKTHPEWLGLKPI